MRTWFALSSSIFSFCFPKRNRSWRLIGVWRTWAASKIACTSWYAMHYYRRTWKTLLYITYTSSFTWCFHLLWLLGFHRGFQRERRWCHPPVLTMMNTHWKQGYALSRRHPQRIAAMSISQDPVKHCVILLYCILYPSVWHLNCLSLSLLFRWFHRPQATSPDSFMYNVVLRSTSTILTNTGMYIQWYW